MNERFIRNIMYFGGEAAERLAHCHVAVVGIGGVGSFAAEALARSGVGELTLLDHDVVGLSNTNRQLCALNSTIGLPKAEVMASRALDINPDITVHALCEYYSAETRGLLFSDGFDYIIDAIDLVACKLDLIENAMQRGIPIISALGTGNKSDASLFRVTDISKTENCPFARVIRKELRNRGILRHKVVFSPEKAKKPLSLAELPPGRRSVPSSLPWVPPAVGLMLAGAVVMDLIRDLSG